LNEFAGPTADVHNVLHQIRQRAGIEAGVDNNYGIPSGLSKEQMREVLHNERRLELAFEEHRYFDIRRWKIAETVMNNSLRGVNIQRTSSGVESYDYVDVFEPSFRAPAMYLYPIPYDEVIKNNQMEQNPGW
jgi:starch-binding outer membrane protein, SusD/RagB family